MQRLDTLLNEITIQNSINKSSTVVKRILGIALAQKKNALLDDSKCFKQTNGPNNTFRLVLL